MVTATWNATAAGDDNPTPPTTVTMDFSQFGGSSAVAAADNAGVWTAQDAITAGSLNGATANVTITAANNYGQTTVTGTNNAVVDNQAPLLTGLSPTDNATGVPLNTSLALTFSENMQAGRSGSIAVYRAADNSLIESIPVSGSEVTVSGSTATVVLVTPLPADTTCYVLVDAGAFQDWAGNACAGISAPTTLSFTTGQTSVAGSLQATYGPDGLATLSYAGRTVLDLPNGWAPAHGSTGPSWTHPPAVSTTPRPV